MQYQKGHNGEPGIQNAQSSLEDEQSGLQDAQSGLQDAPMQASTTPKGKNKKFNCEARWRVRSSAARWINYWL